MSERRAGWRELVWAGDPCCVQPEVMVAWTQAGEGHDGQRGTVRGTPHRKTLLGALLPRDTDDWASAQAGMGSPWHDLPPAWFCFSSEP